MSQQQAPWLETAYGWSYGENGWNSGMDSNLLKFSAMFDGNIDGIVTSLPPAVSGQAYFNTIDNRIYFAVGTVYYSTPVPIWYKVNIRGTGDLYQFNGTSLNKTDSSSEVSSRLNVVEASISQLGSASLETKEYFASKAQLDVVASQTSNQTDQLKNDLSSTSANKGTALIGGLISQSIILSVPSQFSTISDALLYLNGYTIVRDAIVTIKVADGTYSLASTVNLNHPQGGQISLIGNTSNPDLCVLTVSAGATFDAVVCSSGNRFGIIDGFHITRPTKAEMPINTTGILASQSATLLLGDAIKVTNWFYGIAARDGSFVSCPNAYVSDSGDVGIWAYRGSTVICDGAISNNASAAGNPWGFGFQAEYGSTLAGTGISATGCKIAGFAALSNSTCRIFNSTTSLNAGSGLFARDGGVIEANGTNTTNNTRYGVEIVEGNGRIFGIASNTGNTLGNTNPFVYINTVGSQAQITSSSGDLRVDSQNNTYFNGPGGAQFGIRNTTAAVNRVEVAGAATGQSPSFIATGSDSNINLQLLPKGTGRIQVGATFAGTVTNNGYIELLSNDGAVLRIAVQRL